MSDRDIRDMCKAKRIDNGKWEKGFYVCIFNGAEKKHYIFTGVIDVIGLHPVECKYEIDPSTRCRCSEKEYMDGEIAYEGDIFESQSCGVIMVLKYGTYQAYCPADECFMDNVGFYAEANGYPQMPIGDLADYALKVGNIFDNPELLEE